MKRRGTVLLLTLTVMWGMVIAQKLQIPMIVEGSVDNIRYETTIVVKPSRYPSTLDDDYICSVFAQADNLLAEPAGAEKVFMLDHKGGQNSYFRLDFERGGTDYPFWTGKTVSTEDVRFGWAQIVGCSDHDVTAYATYAAYDINSDEKLAEATIFGSDLFKSTNLVADQSDGSRLAIALSNQTCWLFSLEGLPIRIQLRTADGRSEVVEVPGCSVKAFFLDEVLSMQEDEIVMVEFSSLSSGIWFGAMGLRFDGGLYSTVPTLP